MGKRTLLALGLALVAVLVWVAVGDGRGQTRASRLPPDAARPAAGGVPPGAELATPPNFGALGEREGALEEARPGVVLVRVHDPEEKPIAGARVRRWRDALASDVLTDEDGRCELAGARDAELDLEVSAAGFAAWRTVLSPGEPLELELHPSIRVQGTVVDADTRRPIPGARVHVRRKTRWNPLVADVVTDEHGAFRLEDVPDAEIVQVAASASGYPEQSAEAPRDPSRSPSAPGRPRRTPRELEIALFAGPTLEFQVVEGAGGLPIARAEVNDRCTDADGRVTVGIDDPLDVFEFNVWAEGFAGIAGMVPGERASALPSLVRLPRLARFEGFVHDEQGRAVADATVAFSLERDESASVLGRLPPLPRHWVYLSPEYFEGHRASASSDARGHYLSPPLLPGARGFAVHAEHPERGDVHTTAGPLGGPGTTTRLDLALVPLTTGTVFGTVRFNDKWLPGSVRWSAGPRSGDGGVDIESLYRLERVPAGMVELSLRSTSLDPVEELVPGTQATVRVETGATTRYDFELALPFADVGGRVTYPDGRPVQGVGITIRHGSYKNDDRSGSNGRWSESVPDLGWEYEVEFAHGEERLLVAGVRAGDARVDLVVPELVTLPVRVVDAASGNLFSGWQLSWRRAGEPDFTRWRQRSDTLKLAPGTIDLLVAAPEAGYPGAVVAGVLIEAGRVPAPVEIRLQRGLELEVELAAGFEPAEETGPVRLELDTPAGPVSRALEFGYRRRMTLNGLAPGRWTLRAAEGVAVEPATVTLPHDGPLVIRW